MMGEREYLVTDRRPIAARRLGWVNRLAATLARTGVSANAISIAGMICSLIAGLCLWRTSTSELVEARILWIAAAVAIQMRLLANLLDGMVAVASGMASRLGEIFNEAPDRVSDAAVLIGLGYAAESSVALGWLAALLAIMTAYVRVLGKTLTGSSDFRGPMAKQHRMFLVTVASACSAILPTNVGQWAVGAYCLAIISAGCLITILRRLARLVSTLRSET